MLLIIVGYRFYLPGCACQAMAAQTMRTNDKNDKNERSVMGNIFAFLKTRFVVDRPGEQSGESHGGVPGADLEADRRSSIEHAMRNRRYSLRVWHGGTS